jgi:hypothetical protein
LSIAQFIAEAHGGHIEVTSKLGQGTKFTVTIPHAEAPQYAANSATTRPRLNILRRGGQSAGTQAKP